jgi:acetylglutamate kinase
VNATMIGHKVEQAVTVRALRGAAPYIHMYKGKVFVIKTGGGAFRELATMRAFVEQVAILHHLGIRVVLVHGGGPQLDEVTAQLGVETRMVQGRRVTDAAAIDATSMVLNGLVNTRLLALSREFGIPAVGLSGVDGGLVLAHRRPPVTLASGETVDYGMVGDIDGVEPAILDRLLDAGFLPVVSPLSADARGQLLNINADTVAANIGSAVNAEKLILCTGAPGILERLDDPQSLISYTDVAGLRRLREEGALSDGMLPKASAIEAAIRGGVRRVHVISYAAQDALLAEIFTNEGTGTLVVADTKALSAAEQAAG